MKIILSIVLLLITGYGQEEAPEAKTNFQIVDSLTILFLQGHLAQIRTNNIDSVALDVSLLEPEIQNYLRVLIGNWFLQNSFKVFRNYNVESSFQGMVLEINRYDLKVAYSKPFEKMLLGSDYVRRQFSLDINGQFYLTDRKKALIAVDKKEAYSDEIPYEEITHVEESPFLFTKGEREDYSFWEKIYEPALAVTSVAIVVYLFFSQRT